jgi:aminoglycoside phosphotransferase (APT) family kinase protein
MHWRSLRSSLRSNGDAMTHSGTPSSDLNVDVPALRSLLIDQHPDLAHLPITATEAGWDNAIFRLGDRMALRVPRRYLAASLIAKEQQWLPRLPSLPLAVPVPLRIGRGANALPWGWSVVPWLEGDAADIAPPKASEATVWADFLLALHQPPPATLPASPVRGCVLSHRREVVEARLARLRLNSTIPTAALDAWRASLEAGSEEVRYWVHGDLHARNVLTCKGELVGVIDWGDVCAGDPATDVASAWALFESPDARREILVRYGAQPPLIARARGWVVIFGSLLLETGQMDNQRHRQMGADMLRRLSED